MGESLLVAGQILTADDLNNLPVTLSQLATGSIASSTAETVIGQFTIPAGDGTLLGGYAGRVYGTADATSTPALTFTVRIGTAGTTADTQVFIFSALTSRASTVMPWAMAFWFYVLSTGSGGTIGGTCHLDDNITAVATEIIPAASHVDAFDTTSAEFVSVTAKWGTSSASNVCRTLGGSLVRI